MYECWIDGNGEEHRISEMSAKYIKNCISQIKNTVSFYSTQNSFSKKDEDVKKVMSHKWCEEYADYYLQIFHNELEIRRRIKNKDYPSVDLNETCDNCGNHKYENGKCENGEVCEIWSPSWLAILDELDEIDSEIARRAGYKCNGKRYINSEDD